MTPRDKHLEKLNSHFHDMYILAEEKSKHYATDDNPLSNYLAWEDFWVDQYTMMLCRCAEKWERLIQLYKQNDYENIKESLIDISLIMSHLYILLDNNGDIF